MRIRYHTINKCSISSLSISILPFSLEMLSKASSTSSFPAEPDPSLMFIRSPTKRLKMANTFLTSTIDLLLIPCKSRNFSAG